MVNTGSTGKIVEQIGTLADSLGWNSRVAYGRVNNNSKLNSYKIGESWDFYAHVLETRLFDRHGLASLGATRKLIGQIKRWDIHIVHLHNIHGYYLNYPELFKFLETTNIQVVWTLHDCWPFTGHCAYFSDINCNKWQSKCFSCPKSANYPSSKLIDRSTKNFELKKGIFGTQKNLHLVTVSNWLKDLTKMSFLSEQPVQCIHNGVDMLEFKPEIDHSALRKKYNLQEKFVYVAAATSWSDHKGFKDYLRLAEILDPDEQIVLIGLSEEKIKILPENIIGISRTENQKELASWYGLANVVLNLSIQESFGMTTIEGFACGTPGIVYNATASPELIKDNSVGYVVETGDISGIHHFAKQIKSNGKHYYQSVCRNYAEKNFDIRLQFLQYIDLYKDLLGK